MAGPVWLQGPVAGVPPSLQPAAHALIECRHDVLELLAALPPGDLWRRPGNAASIGFHLVHAMGSLDRLLTYARGEALTDEQMDTIGKEKAVGPESGDPQSIAARFGAAIDRAIEQLRATRESDVLTPREVGRGRLPSNVLGILTHAGDHTYRHVGQAITTAKALGGQ